ncbi:MAG: DUF2849 domain-containing protein [Rhizobiales bacterium]|nr:DUF2849 domain-containing protein [Hyphomicrobiales bacterium]NRB13782.1 DUF2849 domain-containing protein [Hyphomicrobiales bacterium]
MAHVKPIKPLKTPVSVTANLLLKGLTVYLAPDGTWSANIADAAIAEDLAQEAVLLALANVTVKTQYVVGAYSFAVELVNGKATPIGMREIIRAKRLPTIVPDGLTPKPEWENQFTAANADSDNSASSDNVAKSNESKRSENV